jgi:hypothetical protein
MKRFEEYQLIDIEELDDAIWQFVQVSARRFCISDLRTDEFDNEKIAEVRDLILDQLFEVDKQRINDLQL